MVLGQQQLLEAGRQQQHGRPEQRTRGQVERQAGVAHGQLGSQRACIGRVEAAQVDEARRLGPAGIELLPGRAVDLAEDGAQCLVAIDDEGQRPFQGQRIERAAQLEDLGNDVGRALAEQAVEEPQPALGEGQRRALVARHGADQLARGLEAGLQHVGQVAQRGVLEQLSHAQVEAELLTDFGAQADRQQRVAAGLEEVVGSAHGPFQELAPDLDQGLLQRRTGLAVSRLDARCGQVAAVDLAVAIDRQTLQHDQRGRHHITGQLGLEVGAQFAALENAIGAIGFDVADEAAVAGARAAGDDNGAADAGRGLQHALEMAQLDAEAADLDLVVEAAEEAQVAAGLATNPVADEVEAVAGQSAVGVGHERESRLGRFAQVATGQAAAGGGHLARHAEGQQGEEAVEHVAAGMAEGSAQGNLLTGLGGRAQ